MERNFHDLNDMPSPLVTIIIPIYNSEKYISETLQSIYKQTYKRIEVIIVDDGSNDNSYAFAKQHQKDQVFVYSQTNKGASAARNFGLAKAKGKYIQFLDADDLLSESKIEEQVILLEETSNYLATCTCVHFLDDTNHLLEPRRHEWIKEESDDPVDFLTKLYGGSLIGPQYGGMIALHTWLIPSKIIDIVGLWDEKLSLDDDGEFMCRVILASKGIKYAKNCTAYYRKYQSNKNLSSATNEGAHISLLNSTKLKMAHILSVKDTKLIRSAFSRVFLHISASFYPSFPNLTLEAEQIGKSLDPKQKVRPYNTFLLKYLSMIIGWRKVKLLSKFKNSLKTHQ